MSGPEAFKKARPGDRSYYQALRLLGYNTGAREPAAADLDDLIQQHQQPYPDPERRAWIAERLREWQARMGR